jgi:hypothetical protein
MKVTLSELVPPFPSRKGKSNDICHRTDDVDFIPSLFVYFVQGRCSIILKAVQTLSPLIHSKVRDITMALLLEIKVNTATAAISHLFRTI